MIVLSDLHNSLYHAMGASVYILLTFVSLKINFVCIDIRISYFVMTLKMEGLYFNIDSILL